MPKPIFSVATPESPLPVVGYQALRVFGAKNPRLLDLDDSGEFWYPGWNEAFCAHPKPHACSPFSSCKHLAWATLALAKEHHSQAEDGNELGQNLPPAPTLVYVVFAGTGTIDIEPGLCWSAQFVKICALISDSPSSVLQQLAAIYQVPILSPASPFPIHSLCQEPPLPQANPTSRFMYWLRDACLALGVIFLGSSLGFSNTRSLLPLLGVAAFLGVILLLTGFSLYPLEDQVRRHLHLPPRFLQWQLPNPRVLPNDPFGSFP